MAKNAASVIIVRSSVIEDTVLTIDVDGLVTRDITLTEVVGSLVAKTTTSIVNSSGLVARATILTIGSSGLVIEPPTPVAPVVKPLIFFICLKNFTCHTNK